MPYQSQKKWRKENPVKRSIISAFAKARARAAKRGVPYDIPRGTTKELFDRCGGKCEISGIPFRATETGVCSLYSPSLDRIKPELGYVKGNIRLILHGLNALKADGTDEDMLEVCRAVSEFNRKRPAEPALMKDPLRDGLVRSNTEK